MYFLHRDYVSATKYKEYDMRNTGMPDLPSSYLGMSLVQNGGSYLMYVLACVGKTGEMVTNWKN